MNLSEIQEEFNKHYNFNELKEKSLKQLEELLYDKEFLKEMDIILPCNLTIKDLKIEFISSNLILNDTTRAKPYFFMCMQLIDPKNCIAYYKYDIEYSIDGDLLDDYFFKI